MSTDQAATNTPITKQPTGIAGLDELLGGGIPDRRITLMRGGPGAGKTVMATQALHHHVARGGTAVVVGFEEQPEELVENLQGFSWTLPDEARERLHFIDARLDDHQVSDGQFDIAGLLATVEARLDGADGGWVLLDGLDMLLRILETDHQQRHELYRLKRWTRDRNLTVLLTAKMEPDTREWSAGFFQYSCDCVIELRNRMLDRVFNRSVRVAKYRGSDCILSEVSFIIGDRGIEVPYRDTRNLRHAVSTERVSTGIDRLDTLVGGGFMRGTNVLISGAPGTAKTTLAASFLGAAARRGENGLFVSFDESAEQIVLNARSVGIRLDKARDEGLLRLMGFRASTASAEEHYARILEAIDEFKPRCLAIDPISALLKSGGRTIADTVAERLLDYAKTQGITSVFTSLLRMGSQNGEDTESQVSTLADTWINLTYASFEGERNRALSIIKSRGSPHSNQVRELVLSDRGVELRDVYTAGGAVLMGTARLEREAENRAIAAQQAMEHRIERERLEAEIEDSEMRLKELEHNLAHRRRRLEMLEEQHRNRDDRNREKRETVRQTRRADLPDPDSR